MSTQIKRQPLAVQTRALVAKQIIVGKLAPGSRLNETTLAQELGVSRTPVRQALTGLERDGLVIAEPDRGFFVASLDREEALELYPILATLEPFALRVNGTLMPKRLAKLREINGELRSIAGDPAKAVELNFAWHERLILPCENGRLGQLVQSLWDRVRRYEHAFYAPGRVRLETSADLHSEILEALEGGAIQHASSILERHWLTDLDQIVPAADDSTE
ncbi:MAG: GntR family transcriptional regulator [Gemmatimonadota bacterium]